MRITLRDDHQQLTIVRAFEARGEAVVREFTSEHLALTFLQRLVGADVDILNVRRELEGTRETTDVMRMSDYEILRTIAELLARGALKVIVTALARPTLSVGVDSAKAKAAPGKAPPIEHKPAPIVPQEYPILARVESNEIINSTRRLVADLQKLVHLLFNRNLPPSQVAAEYVSTAGEVASETRQAIGGLHINIEQLLFRFGSLLRPKPAVAPEYATLGKTEGKLAGGILVSFSAGLSALLWTKVEAPTDAAATGVTRGLGGRLRSKKATGVAKPLPPKKPEKPAEPPIAKTSIVLKVVWSGTGAPVPSIKLKIKMPSGSETEVKTNAKGEVRLGGIAPGECEVRTDIKGATRRDILEVDGPAGGGLGGAGEGSIKYTLARVERYKVKTGDTLATVAAKVGMSASELAKFSWGGDDPDTIREALRSEIGCTKKTPDGKSYIFDDSDKPGILLLPKPLEERGLATGAEHVFSVAKLPGQLEWTFSW